MTKGDIEQKYFKSIGVCNRAIADIDKIYNDFLIQLKNQQGQMDKLRIDEVSKLIKDMK